MSGIPITKPTLIIQKKFPSGFFFASSGLFFALTLLVIFLSDDPAGFPAAVAYISCLTLSITSAFAPFFASYFINLNLRLHQIESAILDLSLRIKDLPFELQPTLNTPISQTGDSASNNPSTKLSASDRIANTDFHDESQEKPSHSEAVMLMVSENKQTESLESPEASDPIETPVTKSSFKRKRTQTREHPEGQEPQLSLFSFEDVVEPKTEPVPEEPLVKIIPPGECTRVVAYILLQPEASLHLVGDFPFSWNDPLELTRKEVGTYLLESFEIVSETQIAFQSCSTSGALRSAIFELKPGTTNEYYPEFASD